jgi:multiple sugar transport system permease protein
MTFLVVALMAGFLSPLVHALSVSLKTPSQISQADAPIWPADPRTFEYQGKEYDVYFVPIDGTVRELALVTPRRTRSEFVDPRRLMPGSSSGRAHGEHSIGRGSWRRGSRTIPTYST